jgi:hypothetical protein
MAVVRKKKNEWHHALQQTPRMWMSLSFTLGWLLTVKNLSNALLLFLSFLGSEVKTKGLSTVLHLNFAQAAKVELCRLSPALYQKNKLAEDSGVSFGPLPLLGLEAPGHNHLVSNF